MLIVFIIASTIAVLALVTVSALVDTTKVGNALLGTAFTLAVVAGAIVGIAASAA